MIRSGFAGKDVIQAGGEALPLGPKSPLSVHDNQFGATREDDRNEQIAECHGGVVGDADLVPMH